MIVATYLPFKEEQIEKDIYCFPIRSVEEGVVNSILFGEHTALPEVLYFIDIPCKDEDFKYEENTLVPLINLKSSILKNSRCLKVQIGDIVSAGSFICDDLQREAFPDIQDERRKKCMFFINRLVKDDTYPNFVHAQKKAFEMTLLPIWIPFILSDFDHIGREIYLDLILSLGDKKRIEKRLKDLNESGLEKEDKYKNIFNFIQDLLEADLYS